MTRNKLQNDLDQGFIQAYARITTGREAVEVSSKGAHGNPGEGMVRVTISAGTANAKASFDPVSSEQDQVTREMNQKARLGYALPKVSTR